MVGGETDLAMFLGDVDPGELGVVLTELLHHAGVEALQLSVALLHLL